MPTPIQDLRPRTESIRSELAAGQKQFDADAVGDLLAAIDFLDSRRIVSSMEADAVRVERDDLKERLIESIEEAKGLHTRVEWLEGQSRPDVG